MRSSAVVAGPTLGTCSFSHELLPSEPWLHRHAEGEVHESPSAQLHEPVDGRTGPQRDASSHASSADIGEDTGGMLDLSRARLGPTVRTDVDAAHGLKVKGKGAGARLGKGLDPLLWMLHHEVTVEHARPPRRVGVGKGVSGLAQGLERGKAKSDVWSKYSVLRDKTVRENALARSGEATRAQDVGAGRPPTWCPGLATSRRARSDERGDPRLDPSS